MKKLIINSISIALAVGTACLIYAQLKDPEITAVFAINSKPIKYYTNPLDLNSQSYYEFRPDFKGLTPTSWGTYAILTATGQYLIHYTGKASHVLALSQTAKVKFIGMDIGQVTKSNGDTILKSASVEIK